MMDHHQLKKIDHKSLLSLVQPHTEPLTIIPHVLRFPRKKGCGKPVNSPSLYGTEYNVRVPERLPLRQHPFRMRRLGRAIEYRRSGNADTLYRSALQERLDIVADGTFAAIRQYLLDILQPAIAGLPD